MALAMLLLPWGTHAEELIAPAPATVAALRYFVQSLRKDYRPKVVFVSVLGAAPEDAIIKKCKDLNVVPLTKKVDPKAARVEIIKFESDGLTGFWIHGRTVFPDNDGTVTRAVQVARIDGRWALTDVSNNGILEGKKARKIFK